MRSTGSWKAWRSRQRRGGWDTGAGCGSRRRLASSDGPQYGLQADPYRPVPFRLGLRGSRLGSFAMGDWGLQILNRIRELTAVEPDTVISRDA